MSRLKSVLRSLVGAVSLLFLTQIGFAQTPTPSATPTLSGIPIPTNLGSPFPTAPSAQPPATATPNPTPTPAPTPTPVPTPNATDISGTGTGGSGNGGSPAPTASPSPNTGDGSGRTDSGTAPPTPSPLPELPEVRPARKVVEINKASVLGGELSWLYQELKAKLAAQGITLDDQGHQINLEPGLTIKSSSTVDDLPPEWYSIMEQIAREKGFMDVTGDSDYLIAPRGGAGTVIAGEMERAGNEQRARDQVQSEIDRIKAEQERERQSGNGGNGTGGSPNPENVPDLTGNNNGNGTGSTGGTTPTTSGNGGTTPTPSPTPSTTPTPTATPSPNPDGTPAVDPNNPSTFGISVQGQLTPEQQATMAQALRFLPKNAARNDVSLVFENAQTQGPNTAGLWSAPPPKVQIFPIGHNNSHACLHEFVHNWIEGKDPTAFTRFKQAFDALPEADKQKVAPSQYAAQDTTGGHELAAESISFYLQNKVTTFGTPQVPYKERIPPALAQIIDQLVAEQGGLP